MKKLFLMAAIALNSMVVNAQTNQMVWLNGRAVLGQSIDYVDSLKFGEMEGDTLHLILPHIAYIHDTLIVQDTIIVHDTVYVNKCDSGRAPEGAEMVDLGLSVKWANMNVGATKEEEYGDYFAWGETKSKTEYNWSTYTYCKGTDNSLTKYCVGSYYGTVDSITTLEAADDAAHVNWGGNWRMPTQAEQEELYTNCTITLTNNYKGTGIAGRIFTSNKPGYSDRSVFFPAAGYYGNTQLLDEGSSGQYWSSSLYIISSTYAWNLLCTSNIVNASYGYRYYGRSVRAVCP